MRYLLPLCATMFLALGCGSAESEDPAQTTSDDLEQETPATITFGADWSTKVTGTLRAGTTVTVKYAEERAGDCRSTQGGMPQFGTTGYAQLGGGEVEQFAAAGLMNGKSELVLPLGKGGDLSLWFETTNRYGCHEYDSAYGQNYHFTVKEALHYPDWVGAASFVTSRATCDGGPCDQDRHDLAEGFVYDTWTRERAAIKRIDFRAYEPGLTDRDDGDLWKKLDTQVHYRFGGTGDYQDAYVDYDTRVGNDARYALQLASLDPLNVHGTVQSRSECPQVALAKSADGQYVSATVDFYFTVQGAELRPDGGGTFTGTYSNYAPLFAVCTQ